VNAGLAAQLPSPAPPRRRVDATHRERMRLRVAPPFELEVALLGHGWIDLAPHRWRRGSGRFDTAIAIGGGAVDVAVTQRGGVLGVDVTGARPLAPDDRRGVRAALRRMLRLDHDYRPFWRRCAATPGLAWVARRGGGRLLAGASLFEDLLKLLFTTNCSWAATRLMVQRVVEALGTRTPSGRAAFPDAVACARQPERFWRDVVRAGYRAGAAHELARRFASGELRDEQFEDARSGTADVRRRLLAIAGFGPYAAGQALRLLGRHDDLALDSWCRGKLARLLERRRPPSDRQIERRYARHRADRGLVLWMELTADWHGEAALRERDGVLAALRAGG